MSPAWRLAAPRLALLCGLWLPLGCRTLPPATRAAPAPAPTVSALAAPGKLAESPAFEALLEAFVREHGALQIPRVSLWAEPEAGSPWAVVVARPGEPAAVFEVAVAGGALEATELGALPVASRAEAAVPFRGALAVLLRSGAAFDQPAGLRGVQLVAASGPGPALSTAERLRIGAARSEAELGQALGALPADTAPADQEAFEASRHRQIQAVRQADAALDGALSAGGAALVRVWQDVLYEPRGRLEQGQGPGAPGYRELLAAVRAVNEVGCGRDGCPAALPDGSTAQVGFAREGGEARIDALLTLSPPLALRAPRAPHRVEPNRDVRATRALLARLELDASQVVAEASLTGGSGTVGVFYPGGDGWQDAQGVVEDGEAIALGDLAPLENGTPPTVRFADVDGDGRTDIVVRFEASRQPYYRLMLSPRALGESFARDVAGEVAMFDKRSIDEALRAAMALPQRGASRAEVCGLLRRLPDRARRREVVAPGARLIEFSEPQHIVAHFTVRPLASASAAQAARAAELCESITCAPGRPACGFRDEISFHAVTLRFQGDRVLLGDMVIYTGS